MVCQRLLSFNQCAMNDPQDSHDETKRFRNFDKLGFEKTEQLKGPFESQGKTIVPGKIDVPETKKQTGKTVAKRHAELDLAADAHFAAHKLLVSDQKRKAFILSVGLSLAVTVGALLALTASITQDATASAIALGFTILTTIASCFADRLEFSRFEREHYAALASWTELRQDLVGVMSLPTHEMREATIDRLERKAYWVMGSDAGQRIAEKRIMDELAKAANDRGIEVRE